MGGAGCPVQRRPLWRGPKTHLQHLPCKHGEGAKPQGLFWEARLPSEPRTEHAKSQRGWWEGGRQCCVWPAPVLKAYLPAQALSRPKREGRSKGWLAGFW